MTKSIRPQLEPWIYPALAGLSLVVGWLIPDYYDWTGSDQSRPSPLIWKTAVGMIAMGVVFCGALPWIAVSAERSPPQGLSLQFKIRSLLGLTAAAAVVAMSYQTLPVGLAGGTLLIVAWAYALAKAFQHPRLRWPVAGLLACMYLPFTWVVGWNLLFNMGPQTPVILASLPAILITTIVGSLAGHHPETLLWLSTLWVSAQLVLGVRVLAWGSRSGIGYLVATLIASTLGSFVLNALVRS